MPILTQKKTWRRHQRVGCALRQWGTAHPRAHSARSSAAARSSSVDDPHYYSYQYVVKGKPGQRDGSYQFTALAFGHLDCDGKYSTYSMTGTIDLKHPDAPSETGKLVVQDALE